MPAARTDVPWTEIAVQAAAGATLQELADHYGLPIGTLRARSTREGWKREARQVVAAKTGTEVAKPQQSPMHTHASDRGLSLMQKLKGKTKLAQAKTVYKTAKGFSKLPEEALMARTQDVKNNVDSAAKLWPEEQASTQPLVAIQLNGYVPPEAK